MSKVKCLICVLALTVSVFAQSEKTTYDPSFRVGIDHCTTEIDLPKLVRKIYFENGLVGFFRLNLKCDSEELATRFAEEQLRFAGDANIICLWDMCVNGTAYYVKSKFAFVSPKNDIIHCHLMVDPEFDFSDTPTIVEVRQDVETIRGWFSNSYKYAHILELSDGTRWKTFAYEDERDLSWSVGDRIVVIGSQRFPGLVNVDAMLEMNSPEVNDESSYLDGVSLII